ncbi:MAG: hypothetical protein H7Z17_01395 [Fuerstia sp.]|nr:hypothetical protein [Fuerstiella sp.]
MWNPFRRKQASASAFPKPAWAPIQNVDSIDIVGVRCDGGADLAIVASQPIDNSEETLDSIRQKFATYLEALECEEFQSEMGHPPRDKTTIILVCEYKIHPETQIVIEECRTLAAAKGVSVAIQTTLG